MNAVRSRVLALVALGWVGVFSFPSQSQATTIFDLNFSLGDPAAVRVTVDDISGGVQVTVDVLTGETGIIGDLRGVFLNIDVTGLSLLASNIQQVSGGPITEVAFNTSNLGNGANVNPLGPFDIGIEIGTSGIGKGDDYQSVTFNILSALLTSEAIGPGENLAPDFAVRLTSVGLANPGDRDGSAKLIVPEPGSLALLGVGVFALAGLVGWRRRRSPAA